MIFTILGIGLIVLGLINCVVALEHGTATVFQRLRRDSFAFYGTLAILLGIVALVGGR